MSKTNYELAVETRSELGSGAMRRARKAGKIPAVIYSRGTETKSLFVNASEWEALTKHEFNLVSLIEGKNKTAAVVKEVQSNFLKGYVVHIDFQEVKMDEKITAAIPVVTGHEEAAGVSKGGTLDQVVHEIEVSALPADLPEHIEVDVTALEVGESMHIGDIKLPAKVELVSDPELVIFTVSKPITEEEAEGTAGEEAGEVPEIGKEEAAEAAE
jgi:large subunit ribosomal protein L25